MRRIATIAVAVLSLALLVSATMNVLLYRRGRECYVQLNSTRIDPFGLGVYTEPVERSKEPIVVFFGDSRAAEWPTPAGITNATFINRGIGGQTTAQVLGRFRQHVLPLKPQVIVIQVGVNDLKTIPLFPEQKETIVRTCETNIDQLVKMSLDSGARVVVTTIFPLGRMSMERRLFWSDDFAAAIVDVNAFIGTLATDRVVIFNTSQVLADSRGKVDPKYSRDFLHLNSKGYAALNQAMTDIWPP